MIENAGSPLRAPHSVASLSRTFSKSLRAGDLCEALLSLDDNQPVDRGLGLMRTNNVSVLGVRREGLVVGWVGMDDLTDGTLGDRLREFSHASVLPETAGLNALLDALASQQQVFVEWRGEITGVITRRDLQKPPLRMWLFGAITVLDTNMTWAIEQLYPADTWSSVISTGRFEKAAALRAHRQKAGSDCRLVDCLQIKDKADILVADRASFSLLGVKSRREANDLASDIESLRNHLAHSQELEDEHLETATRLALVLDTILRGAISQRIVESQREKSGEKPPEILSDASQPGSLGAVQTSRQAD